MKKAVAKTTKLSLDKENYIKWGRNVLFFSAPAMAIFFGQFAVGVELEKALPLAMYALYGLLADWFKKYSSQQ